MGRDEAAGGAQRQVTLTHHAQETGLVLRSDWHHGTVLSRRWVNQTLNLPLAAIGGGDPGGWETRQQAGAGTGQRGQG